MPLVRFGGRIVDSRGPRIILIISCSPPWWIFWNQTSLRFWPCTWYNTLPSGFLYSTSLQFFDGVWRLCGAHQFDEYNGHDTQADLHSQRASTTGLVIAGFGLSAFFFITVSLFVRYVCQNHLLLSLWKMVMMFKRHFCQLNLAIQLY